MKFLQALVRIIGVAFLLMAAMMFLIEEKSVGAVFTVFGALLTFVFPKKMDKKKSASPALSKSRETDQPRSIPRYTTELVDNERLTPLRWVVLDTETTGLRPGEDRIIEFSGCLMEAGKTLDTFTTLINPKCELPPHITRITGITEAELKSARSFRAVARRISAFIGENPVVGHNAKFDVDFLTAEFARAGTTWTCNYIDTVDMARDAFPGMKNYKLNTLIKEFGLLDHAQEHRAESDVEATAKLYMLCREQLTGAAESESPTRSAVPAATPLVNRSITVNCTPAGISANNMGRKCEAEGDIDKAIQYYEKAVAAGFERPHPYKRLAVLYRKRKDFENEIRICRLAMEMLARAYPNEENAGIEFQARITAAQGKLERASRM